MIYLSARKEKIITGALAASVIMNFVVHIFIVWRILPFDLFSLRFTAGFFLLLFVCLHGWYRYGRNIMTIYFALTLAITWSAETLSIYTGIPFGSFNYTDLLGEKIGSVPILIFPAYFFNSYLAWTLGGFLAGGKNTRISNSNFWRVPLVASLLMVIWNLGFDPIMSTIEGNWIWHEGGIYFGVPVSNFVGWFITVYLVFQIFALVLLRTEDTEKIDIRPTHWYLFPAMYLIQGMPALFYPFFRDGHAEIYQPVAIIALLTLSAVVITSVIKIRQHIVNKYSSDFN